MGATTIKLDGAVAERLRSLKPSDETLTGFVRSILEAEIRRRKLREAADKYMELLRAHPEEAAAMDTWSSAPLERAPGDRRAR